MKLIDLLKLNNTTILTGSDAEGNRYLGQMLRYYSEIYGQSCFSCPKKFPVYLNQLRNRIMKNENKESKGKFELSKGVTIPIFGTSEVYSDRNITDEAALKVLSRNPKASKLFKKLPKDWEDQVEAYIEGTKASSLADLENLKVEALRVLFPKAKGRSREDLLKDIAEKYPELDADRKAKEEAEAKAKEE